MHQEYSQMFNKAGSVLSSKRACAHACALGIVAWFLILKVLLSDSHPGGDFKAFYTAAVIAKVDPQKVYDIAAQWEIQSNFGATGHFHYLNPPPFTALLVPLAYLPYKAAFWLWTAVSTLLYLVSIGILLYGAGSSRCPRPTPVFIVAVAAPAFQWVIFTGQTTSLALFFWTLVFYLLRERRFAAAGAALGPLLFRVQFLVIVIPLMVLKRFTKVLQAFFVSWALLILFGALTMTFSSYHDYVSVLLGFWARIAAQLQPLSRYITLYGNIRTYLPAGWALVLTAVAALPLLNWLIQMWRGDIPFDCRRFELQFAALILATLLLMHHGLVYDLLLITIPALLIYMNRDLFPPYYKLLLAFIYFSPYYFLLSKSVPVNPVPPLLYWLSFEIYRAHRKVARD